MRLRALSRSARSERSGPERRTWTGASAFGLAPDAASFFHRLQNLDGFDAIDGGGERITVQDHEIGEQACFDAAFAVFFENLPGGAGGEGLECLIRVQPLVVAADDAGGGTGASLMSIA